jgi:hypothetical protein
VVDEERAMTAAANKVQRSRRAVKLMAARLVVYDGRERLGTIQAHADGWHALDRLHRPLGIFPTRDQALAAVCDSLRGAP